MTLHSLKNIYWLMHALEVAAHGYMFVVQFCLIYVPNVCLAFVLQQKPFARHSRSGLGSSNACPAREDLARGELCPDWECVEGIYLECQDHRFVYWFSGPCCMHDKKPKHLARALAA